MRPKKVIVNYLYTELLHVFKSTWIINHKSGYSKGSNIKTEYILKSSST